MPGDRRNRDLWIAGGLWLVLSIVGVLIATIDFYPEARSDKGEEIERAFRILFMLAMPVFMLVVTAVGLALFRYRTKGEPVEDGPPLTGEGGIPKAWFAITSGLCVLVMIFPGLTSLKEITRNDDNPDLVVQVDAVQWAFVMKYPEYGITSLKELVLPVDKTVQFQIKSLDVVHSVFIPAFLMKIDAVPNQTTMMTLKPTKTGTYEEDQTLRVQCAELCGLDHAQMMMPVRVVTAEEFQAWVDAQPKSAPQSSATPAGDATQLSLAASGTRFTATQLEAASGKPIAVKFDNQDAGVFHNFALYTDEAHTVPVPGGATQLAAGPVVQDLTVDLKAGTYYFRCDVHPVEMTGTLVVK